MSMVLGYGHAYGTLLARAHKGCLPVLLEQCKKCPTCMPTCDRPFGAQPVAERGAHVRVAPTFVLPKKYRAHPGGWRRMPCGTCGRLGVGYVVGTLSLKPYCKILEMN